MRRVAPGVAVVPVRTPTLPPATHTNTWIVGDGELTVFDPASPWEDEQGRLAQALTARVAEGERVARIVLTHHHADHVGGAEALRRQFPDAPILAHPRTTALVADAIRVDRSWEDGEALDCGGRRLVATFTPGHAPGHLVFQDADSGVTIAGDMVAGVGTILIDPRDGDLGEYLDSLARLRALAPTLLLPAHGEPLDAPDALLAFYIAHRHQRTAQIRDALLRDGPSTPDALAPTIYPELPPIAWPLGAAQIHSHLRWMNAHGLAHPLDDGRWRG